MITFEPIPSEDLIERPAKKQATKKKIHTGIKVTITGVDFYLKEDTEEKPETITTLDQMLELSTRKPANILSISPPLHSVFRSKVDGKLEPYVKVGDVVHYKKSVYMPVRNAGKKGSTKDLFEVTKVEISSIRSMAIISASLNNGDHSILTNFLQKV